MTIAEVVADNVRFLESKGKHHSQPNLNDQEETIDISDDELPF